ncbi:MAG: carbohydrate ABC transporter permease [Anaerolineae bacterium]|nr:carbohydrate ABC transporter permease [Anaerolineae bacterium]
MHRRRPSTGNILAYVVLIGASAVFLTPLVWMVRSSFMSNFQILKFPPDWIPNPILWQNYPEALKALEFTRVVANTLRLVILNSLGIFITAPMSAYAFGRLRWPGRNLFWALILSTMMLPGAVTLIPTFLGWRALGAINTYYPLWVSSWFGGHAFNIFLLRQFFLTLPRELEEAAVMDGAGRLRILWTILVPLSKPAIVTIIIFDFLYRWNELLAPIIYLYSEPKFTLAMRLASFRGMYHAQFGYLMAASTVTVLPIIALYFAAQQYFVEGIALTGIKG